MRAALAVAAALVAACLSTPAFAQKSYGPGVSDTEIKIGNTMPYSGPASPLSITGRVIAAYFDEVNEKGGVNGRKLNLISLDDAFSPPKTMEAARRLVESEGVAFIFVNLFGYPGLMAHQKGVPRSKDARRCHAEWGATASTQIERLDALTRVSERLGTYFGAEG